MLKQIVITVHKSISHKSVTEGQLYEQAGTTYQTIKDTFAISQFSFSTAKSAIAVS